MSSEPEASPNPADYATPEFAEELALLSPALEAYVGVTRDDLASLFLLETVKGFGPQKFKELHVAGLRPIDVLLEPHLLPTPGKRGDQFRQAIGALTGQQRYTAQARAVRQLVRARKHNARILTYESPAYPPNVYASNNAVPVLYVRGTPELVARPRAVACVGSREIGPPYTTLHAKFAGYAARQGFAIVSGFALGADTIGHRAAVEAGGETTLVMPCGLDRPFPPENKHFFEELMSYPRASAVSEFPFGTAASTLTLRKRNKLIVAFAQGVLLSQTSAKGGAMNAFRFAREQHKHVATFMDDGLERTSGNREIANAQPGPAAKRQQGRLMAEHDVAAVFPSDPDEETWGAWLRRLSSST